MPLLIDTPLPSPAQLAAQRLEAALTDHPTIQDPIIVGLADVSPAAGAALAAARVTCPPAPESLAITHTPDQQIVAAGRDPRGLAYAVAELTRATQCLAPGQSLADHIITGPQSPLLPWRSIQVFLCNADCERDWFFSTNFWDDYLALLIANRFNNLSLTVGHQTSYLTPPYPFFVDIPEFPHVHAEGIDETTRAHNLHMLQWISQRARDHGLHFTFGIWTQRPGEFGDAMVHDLPDEHLAQFNALGLKNLLAACPAIDGVQFRMNYESGIAEHLQQQFYESQFDALAQIDRPIRLDLRAKGLSDHVVEAAQSRGLNTIVSTKFWCEHLAMPYAMPAIRTEDVTHSRRYGYWDLLTRPRKTDLIYRLWSAGSQRVLQWGSADWVRRFIHAAAHDSAGIEVMAPLTNKGGFNVPGNFPIITDSAYQPYTDEQQRYFLFYTLFGRLAYDPDAPRKVWRRELQQRFSAAADPMANAYESAGRILPLLTVVLQWSASLWSFWTETYAGRRWRRDLDVEPSDPTQFYGISEYVSDALAKTLNGKWTPFHVADQLADWSTQTCQSLDRIDPSAPASNPELNGAILDCRILAHLGAFHAHRLRAAAHLAIAQRTSSETRYHQAVDQMRRAHQQWIELADATHDVYHPDLLFGDIHFGHCGHWTDRLSAVEAQLTDLNRLADQIALRASTPHDAPLPGEGPLPALTNPTCTLPESASPDTDLPIQFHLASNAPTHVICHAKPMLQPLPFIAYPMQQHGADFAATIPAAVIDPALDFILFFEIHLPQSEARRFPDWRSHTPYLRLPTSC
ncbi:MAG: hypothetical protein CMJ49_05765 [Planctomycetaceae bacterium]|nr:hypothetical protein [Planctomycetaceae bacterium]